MRHSVSLLVLALLALAGCGSDQEATDTPSPAAAQEAPATEAPPAPQEMPAGEAGDKPEIVEESAAVTSEPAAKDQQIVLAQSATTAPAGNWKFKEGKQFQRLVPTQPTVGGADKIEVAEFFWYGCSHCFDFESYLNAWAETAPSNVRFVHVPALWNPLVKLHGQLYFTEEVLEKNGKLADPQAFRAAVFNEYHRRGNRLASVAAIQALFERFGVSAEDFQNTWKSFEVDQKLRVAEDLARRYSISGVPTIVVNGKYRTGAAEAGGYPQLIEVINELVARESAR